MESEASCRSTAVSEDEIGRCRFEDDDTEDECCCSCSNCPPHIFTSILLGLLACVLVSGGVFLAFHKWDHTWLLVSAVGVILMIIGTALHCCSASKNDRKKHRCKGGCGNAGRNSKPDPLGNGGGMLAEQLLPLSNARSVSQLSLNMVPGYFPPIVYPAAGGPYGLEQHSAVVQNISRLVQHQQQLHLQVPSSTPNGDGARSFILLSLPADTNAANIQNIVNAVCQLDPNSQTESNGANNQTATEANSTAVPSPNTPAQQTDTVLQTSLPQAAINTTDTASCSTLMTSSSQPALKNAEVQTCSNWPSPATSELKLSAPNSNANCASSQPVDDNAGCNSNNCSDSTSTIVVSNENGIITDDAVHVTDENAQRTGSSDAACLIDIDGPMTSQTETAMICDNQQQFPVVQLDIPIVITNGPALEVDLMDVSSDPPPLLVQEPTNLANTIQHSNQEGFLTAEAGNCNVQVSTADTSRNSGDVNDSVEVRNGDVVSMLESGEQITTASDSPSSSNTTTTQHNSSIDEPSESLSDFDEDSELLDRSSPPPSYEDVTQESQTPAAANGAIGLAYGTL